MAIAENTNPVAEISSAMPRDYFDLLKPRVMSLVVFTALVGMIIAPVSIGPALGAIAILCIAVGAGASGALNMWYDADIDAVMTRTASRPIPGNRISRSEALTFGLVLAAFSVVTLGLLTNWVAAGLLAFTIFFYAVIYTAWLKRSTPQNIVIGGAAGAFPPVIGWAAMTGSVSIEPLVLFMIIFLWTPPHFWALALFRAQDYAKAGIPMMPNVAGDKSTRRQILFYSVLLAISGITPWYFEMAGIGYTALATILGLNFVRLAWHVVKDGDDTSNKAAKKLFGFSILYLFALFAALLIENLIFRML